MTNTGRHKLACLLAIATTFGVIPGAAAQAPSQQAVPESAAPSTPTVSASGTPLPAASSQTDPVLEARLPHTVGGLTLTIESRRGAGSFPGIDPAAIQPLVDGLAAQGKTLADLSIAIGHNDDYTIAITAMYLPGSDARGLTGSILAMAPPDERIEQAQASIGGKDVLTVTDSTGAQQFYASGDTLWIIRAAEPALTEILGDLP